jgi:hypothetical protein
MDGTWINGTQPTLSADGHELIFGDALFSEATVMYRTTRSSLDGPWASSERLSITGISEGAQNGAWLSPDRLTLYFAWSEHIHVARRAATNEAFVFDRELDELSNSSTEWAPGLSFDEREIFFSADPAFGSIMRAVRDAPDDRFGVPETALTFGDYALFDPDLSSDGRTLYMTGRAGDLERVLFSRRDCRD